MSEMIQAVQVWEQSTEQSVDPAVQPLQLDPAYSLFRADVYALLGALLSKAPDAELLQWLAALDLDEQEGAAMREAWQVLQLAAQRIDAEQAADEFQALFIGIGRGELMPFGSWYLTGFLMEKPLVVLRNELQQLGFERQPGVKEPEDHIAALCQVMAMLVHPEEGYPSVRQQQFFNSHLLPWSRQLFRDMQRADSAHFYSAVGRFGELFVEQEALLLEG